MTHAHGKLLDFSKEIGAMNEMSNNVHIIEGLKALKLNVARECWEIYKEFRNDDQSDSKRRHVEELGIC